ncbi:MAG: transcription-repair coupling factor [Desulfobacterales bacterium]
MLQNQAPVSAAAIVREVLQNRGRVEVSGVSGSERGLILARLCAAHDGPLLVAVSSLEEGRRLAEDLRFFGGPEAQLFPPYPQVTFKAISAHNLTAAERIRVLYRLTAGEEPPVVIAPVQALLQRVLPRAELVRYAELLLEGEEVERERLVAKLLAGGYLRTAIVEEPGDFSARGGIVDVFSPLYPDPLRIEFFGDRVESLRFFSAADQRQLRAVGEAVLLPAREAILEPARMPEILNRVRLQAADLGLAPTRVREIAGGLSRLESLSGIESLLPLIYPETEALFDFLPLKTRVVLVAPAELRVAAVEFERRAESLWQAARERGEFCVEPARIQLPPEEAIRRLEEAGCLVLKEIPVQAAEGIRAPAPGRELRAEIQTTAELTAALRRRREDEDLFGPLVSWIGERRAAGLRVVVACRSRSQAERLADLLSPYGVSFRRSAAFPADDGDFRPTLCLGRVGGGFVWAAEGLALLSEEEIFGVRAVRRARPPAPPRERLLGLQELKQGDWVVHSDHGIGRYEGLVRLTVDGVENEFLALSYQGGDRLYLPVDRMNLIQKYLGVEGCEPTLDKLGGASWERVKARVKRSAEKIAGELLQLYARRRVEQGFACRVTDDSLKDFEAGFAYEETPDQIRAIEEVFEDMQQPVPMDRLVCGDVGYGKTEVALRASFLAVLNGKQVAVLVPTTILAEQHFETFRTRFQRHPVQVACLSRFRSGREQAGILEGLRRGTVDIVIGTHRLLQKDVAFKDLGLLIIDEEQRFGVRHKEKLKRLRSTVDVLALTATPIPRTLHLSLTGLRDISLIQTPPEFRKAIVTTVCEFDPEVIADAIRRELRRGGQVYFVHNTVQTIEAMAERLRRLVPEARLGVAHGQMAEEDLEDAMLRFLRREIDVLVCTTIIESGLDVANANTIIIHRADCFGLAQIYQLRGRVGRSEAQAYAYLLIPAESLLTADARKRLKVLMEHSDLGSGFQIAMNDLEIRGGGTILGASQSGHIAAVGYDMFLKLMEEAIAELKGEPPARALEPEIHVPLSAYLAASYVPDIDQRMILYRRLARMTEPREVADMRAEMSDRFGPPPEEAANLLFKILLRILARRAGVERLDVTDQRLVVQFAEGRPAVPEAVLEFVQQNPQSCELLPGGGIRIRLAPGSTTVRLAQVKNILQAFSRNGNHEEN